MRVDLYRYHFPFAWPTFNHALRERFPPHPGYTTDRPETENQGSQVIGPRSSSGPPPFA